MACLGLEEEVEHAERPNDDHDAANELGYELTRVAIEQAPDGSRDAVESITVGSVGEQAEGDESPQAVDAVNGRRTNRVVDLERALDEDDGQHDKDAGDQSDEDRRPRADERTRSGDGHQTRRACR